MKTTPLLNVLLVQHMDVPRVPKVLMLDKCDKLDSYILLPGDLLDANSINNIKDDLTGEIDTVDTKLSNHISDSHCHTTSTEKNYWNNKLDAVEFNTTIAALQSQIPLNPITSANLADALEALGLLDANHNPSGGSGSNTGNYLEEGDFLGTINGIRFTQGEDITIPTSGSAGLSYKITGLSYSNGQITLSQENNTNSPYRINIPTGGTPDQTIINNITNQVLDSISYNPSITSSTSNSYKIGDLRIGSSNTISLYGKDTYGSGTTVDPFVLEAATDNKLGGIKTGFEVDALNRNYAVQLDSNNRAYVNVPWYPGSPGEPTDTTDIENAIRTLQTTILEIQDDIDNLHNYDDSEISTTLSNLIEEWTQWKQHPEDLWSNSNFGTAATDYIQRVINTNLEENGAIWSTINQKYNIINARIDAIVSAGEGDYSALESSLKIYFDDQLEAAITELTSKYVLIDDDSEDADTLAWLLSGFKTQASKNSTFAQMWSDCNEGQVATVKTLVVNGQSAWAYLSAMFDKETLSGVDAKSDLETAVALVFAKKSDMESAFLAFVDDNGPVATMIANNKETSASIIAKINSAGQSEVKINASHIDLQGYVTTGELEAAKSRIGALEAGTADIFDLYAKSADIEQLYAEKTTTDDLTARIATIEGAYITEVQAQNIASEYASVANSLRVGTQGRSEVLIDAGEGSGYPRIVICDDNGDEVTVIGGKYQDRDLSTLKNYIDLDGHGFFAGGNFSWDTDGNVEVAGEVTATSGKIGGFTIDGNNLKTSTVFLNENSFKIKASDNDYVDITSDAYVHIKRLNDASSALYVEGGSSTFRLGTNGVLEVGALYGSNPAGTTTFNCTTIFKGPIRITDSVQISGDLTLPSNPDSGRIIVHCGGTTSGTHQVNTNGKPLRAPDGDYGQAGSYTRNNTPYIYLYTGSHWLEFNCGN